MAVFFLFYFALQLVDPGSDLAFALAGVGTLALMGSDVWGLLRRKEWLDEFWVHVHDQAAVFSSEVVLAVTWGVVLFGVAGFIGEIHWGWLAGLVWGPRIAAAFFVRVRLDARER